MNAPIRGITIVHKFVETPRDHILVIAEMAIALTEMDTRAMVSNPHKNNEHIIIMHSHT